MTTEATPLRLRRARASSLRTITSLARWTASGCIFLLLAMAAMTVGWFVSARRMFPFSQWVFRCMLRVAGVRVAAEWSAQLAPGRGYLYVFNHSSFLDHFVLASQVPGFLVGVEKIESRSIPVYGFVTRWWGNVAIDRGKREEAIRYLSEAGSVLANGVSICAAPEGTRSRDGSVGPFKKGAFHMAVGVAAPIAPVSIVGMNDVNPDGRFQLRRGTVRLVFHPVIETDGIENVEALANRVHEQICSAGLLRREAGAAAPQAVAR